MIVRELLTKLGFDADNRSAERHERALRNVRRAALAVTAATAAIGGAMVAMTQETARAGDQIAKTADRLGLTTTALQELRYAADQSGVSSQTLDMALQRMTRRLSEAGAGGGEAAGAIEELGISAQSLANMAPQDALAVIADALQGVENQSDRVRLAFKFFDSEGVALVNMLGDGSAGLDQMRQSFRDLGGGITEAGTRNAEEFTNAMGDLRIILNNLRYTIGEQLMPVITGLVQSFSEWYKANQDLIRQRIVEFVQGFIRIVGDLFGVISSVAGAINSIVQALGGWETAGRLVVAGMAGLIGLGIIRFLLRLPRALSGATRGFGLLSAAIKRLPGMFLIVSLATILEDLWSWANGMESVAGRILGSWSTFSDRMKYHVDRLRESMQWLFDVWSDLAGLVGSVSFTGPTNGSVIRKDNRVSRLNDMMMAPPSSSSLPLGSAIGTQNNPTINNSFNMQLPPGTPQSQADYVRENVEPLLDNAIRNASQRLLQNYAGAE